MAPKDAGFELIRLDVGPDRRRVRIRGDGSFTTWKRTRRDRVRVWDGALSETELRDLIREMVDADLVFLEGGSVDARVPTVGYISHPVDYALTLRLSGGRTARGQLPSKLRVITRARDVHAERGSGSEAFQAFRSVTNRLLALENHPTAQLREGLTIAWSRPTWSVASASDSPKIAYRTRPADRRRVAYFVFDLESSRSTLWIDIEAQRCGDPGQVVFVRNGEGVLCRQAGGLHQYFPTSSAGKLLIDGFGDSHSAIWTPDGTKMAISVRVEKQSWAALVLGADRKELARYPRAKPLSWSPDGEVLYAVQYHVGRVPPEVVAFRTGAVVRQRVLPGREGTAVSVSPNGRWLAWKEPRRVDRHREVWLYVADRDPKLGTLARHAEPRVLVRTCGGYDWSPDSQHLVFVTCDNGIAVVSHRDSDTELLFAVETGPWWLGAPNWSPDGRTIAFHAADPMRGGFYGELGEIWVVGADGSDPRTVAEGGFPFWLGESIRPEGLINL